MPFATNLNRVSLNSLLTYFQLFVVDLVDIGLMNASEAKGRHRIDDTMRKFCDAITAGVLVGVKTTSGLDHVTVTSLRRCDSDIAGCSNASVVAAESKPRRSAQRLRAVTSSNDAMTSSTWRTVADVICVHFLSLYLNRLLFTADYATS